ncbi:TPR repeat-containing protein [Catenovulum agarivorans DS-2]|uniref:TPR repeat-containing protein n=1 Tax=Catenovulum agarivorans DS-2 TaxID=1328313 RepID=W7Q7T4_9ALTE|nr:SEL1-like repeat protein [Catenovulum agarivorans]EWH08859.1 TPR repeat-containing protein [Catenovulum agarivorans DS-2]
MEQKLTTSLVGLALMLSTPFNSYSANLLKANSLYKQQQYQQAALEYKRGVELNSAHAHYQLGLMYAKGLGVKQDQLNALMYINAAAKQNYHIAQQLLDKMMAVVPVEKHLEIKNLLDETAAQLTKGAQRYLPQIDSNNLSKKFTFDGAPKLDHKVYLDELQDEFGIGFEMETSGAFFDEDDEFSDSSDVSMITTAPPLLVLDHDVAPDGSIRYVNQIQKLGSVNRYIDAYKLFPLPKPTFNGQAAEFVHRAYLGAATYDQFDLVEERPRLYREYRSVAKRGTSNHSLTDQYQAAMAMLNFPWLEDQPNQAEKILLSLAKQGHPSAMYEYGLKLYREQKEIPTAIHWITEASKYGLSRAEYRLARFFQTSPWILHDEEKALFWYQSAIEKGHEASSIRVAEIKLLSQDQGIRNVNHAIELLDKVKDSQSRNPEYYYLLALSYKDRQARDFKKVVDNLEKAIRMADRANWDVSDWEDLLAELTTGRVFIVE